jgi:HTH domain
MDIRAELTIEPFVEGTPGDHVLAASAALSPACPEVGPFATTVVGEVGVIGQLVCDAIVAAFDTGATTATLSVHRAAQLSPDGQEFVAALLPALHSLGLQFVEAHDLRPGEVPLSWRGEAVGAIALGNIDHGLQDQLAQLIAVVEGEFGQSLSTLDRIQKQQAVRSLSRHGAFTVRNAVDVIAAALSVSRATLYNYLRSNRDRDE